MYEGFDTSGGGGLGVFAIIIVLTSLLMIIGGIVLLIIVSRSDEGYDTSILTNKSFWGTAIIGIGSFSLFTFAMGVISGKASGEAGGMIKMIKSR